MASVEVGTPRQGVLSLGRAVRRPHRRRAHRRRPRHLRLLPPPVRRAHGAHPVRRADPRSAADAPPGRDGPHAQRLPPRRRPVRAGEPRARDRPRIPRQRRATAARGRRLRAVRRRLHPGDPERRRGRRADPPRGRRLRPGAPRRALRPRRHLPARPLRRGHQPVAPARHGGGHRGDRLRGALQPGGPRRQRLVLRRRGRRRDPRRRRRSRPRDAHAAAVQEIARTRFRWDDVADEYEDLARRLAEGSSVHASARRARRRSADWAPAPADATR